jgi:uncharacterized protein DUF6318
MNRTPRLMAPLAALCLLLPLTSCDNDNPGSTPPATTTPTQSSTPSQSTPTATPKPTPPVIPPAATTGLTVTSAEAFARFYLSAVDYLVASGDSGLVRQWAEKGCASCDALADKYERMYRAGGYVTGSTRTQVLKVSQASLIRNDTAAVLLQVREGAQIERVKAGAKPTPYPAQTYSWDLTLAAAQGHWTMFEMELKP